MISSEKTAVQIIKYIKNELIIKGVFIFDFVDVQLKNTINYFFS